ITDNSNNIIIVGSVIGDADLDGNGIIDSGYDNSTGYGGADIFISKFNSSGTFQWSKRLGGITGDSGDSVAIDSSNNIIITGYVSGDADLNGDGDYDESGEDNSSNANYAGNDIFISVFDSSGTYLWSKRFGGISNDQGLKITTDNNNNIIVTGTVNGDADLNGDGDYNDTAETPAGFGGNDIFISAFNQSGIHQWSKRLGSTNNDQGNGIDVNSNNDILVTGLVNGNADLDGNGTLDGGPESSAGYGGNDVFISIFKSE
ncbi:hypothetical protein ACFL20_09130, partial [Spirochaetota bacterium]